MRTFDFALVQHRLADERLFRRLRPWAVVAGVLAVALALPQVVAADKLMLATMGLGGLGAVLVFLRRPPLGLIVLLLVALTLPSPPLPGGLNVPVLLLALLVVLWLVDMIVLRKEMRFVHSRPLRPLLTFTVIVLLSFVIGQLPWFSQAQHAPMSAQIGGLLIFVLSTGAFLLAAHQFHDLRWLRWFTWLFVCVGYIHVMGWFVPGIGGITAKIIRFGVIDNAIYWTWLVALAFSQAWLNRDLPWFWRLVFAFITVTTLYVGFVLNRDWKSGYLPAIAAVATIVAARSWRVGLVMALIGVAPALYLITDAVGSDQYSYSTRVDALVIVLHMSTVSPLLGFGPANYYWYTPIYRIRGWAVKFNSHNQYADIVAQVGVIGLLCFIWFAVEMGVLAWRLRLEAAPGFNQAYVYGVIGGLVGTLVAGVLVDWIIPFVYNLGMYGFRGSMLGWIFLGGLLSVEFVTRQGVGREA